MMNSRHRTERGFTLIELVITIVIAGILATVALRAVAPITETARTEETKKELEALSFAMAGNPGLENNGVRSDFGYVGDVGSMPPNLDALVSNPGGYTTWNGPYIDSRFVQIAGDYKLDAWGSSYQYSNTDLISTGSGSSIVRKVANTTSSLLNNSISGTVADKFGAAPGHSFDDSLAVVLVHPDGSGALTTRVAAVAPSGSFSFGSVPIGNHDITAVYLPTGDSLKRFCSVIPQSAPQIQFRFDTAYFSPSAPTGSGSGLIYVAGSATIGGGGCNDLTFSVNNPTSTDISVSSVEFSWSSPTAYYREIEWATSSVFLRSSPRVASGEQVTLTAAQVVAAGATVPISVNGFKNNPTGGPSVDMSNVDFTVQFSDGSSISFNGGGC